MVGSINNYIFLCGLTWGGIEILLLDDRRQSGTPAYVLDDAPPRLAPSHFGWFLSMIPSDVISRLPRPITRVLRRRETSHYDGSSWTTVRSRGIAVIARPEKFHVRCCAPSANSWRPSASIRRRTDVARLETDQDLFIDRNDFGRPSPSGVFPRTRERYHAGRHHGAHMSHANRPRPVLIVVGPKGVAFVAPCLSSLSLAPSFLPSFLLSRSLSFSVFLSCSLSRCNSSTRGNDDWYALYPPRSIVNAPMKGSQIFFTGLRAKESWRKKLLFQKFPG